MKTQTAKASEPAAPIQRVLRLEDLTTIFDDRFDGVVWERRVPPSVLSALEALPTGEVEDARVHVPVGEAGDRIIELFSAWNYGVGPVQRWVADDVQAMAGQMAGILSVSRLRLRVHLVRDDACRKFHRDTVRARLICTYVGPGTEYGVAREGEDPCNIYKAPTGNPILLKGKLWPGFHEPSVLHRSPPIEGTGVSRLVIVIDEAPPQ